MERGEGQIQNNNEAHTSIRRVASHLKISEDRATVLLLRHKWDEEKLESNFKLSPGNGTLSDHFVTNPLFNWAMIECSLCGRLAQCPNLGCDHFCCDKCFIDDIEAKMLRGDLELFCPYISCWKFLSHKRVTGLMSAEANKKYEHLLLENFHQATKPPHIITEAGSEEEDSLIKKIGSQILEVGKDLASTIGENKKEILLVAAMHACSKVFKKKN